MDVMDDDEYSTIRTRAALPGYMSSSTPAVIRRLGRHGPSGNRLASSTATEIIRVKPSLPSHHPKPNASNRKSTDSVATAPPNVIASRCQRRPEEVSAEETALRLTSGVNFTANVVEEDDDAAAAAAAAALAGHLERFHRLVATVGPERLTVVRQRVNTLLSFLVPRLAKLGSGLGLKIIGSVKTGSTFDNTKVIEVDEVDVFVMFDPRELKVVMSEPGYVTIPLTTDDANLPGTMTSKSDSELLKPYDYYKFGRSKDSRFLSPVAVSQTMHSLVEHVARRGSTSAEHSFRLLPFSMESNRSPIIVELDLPDSSHAKSSISLSKPVRINLVPACAVGESLAPVRTMTYVIARPYQHDRDPGSDRTWRLSTADRELRILDCVDRADRGVRRKVIRILKALIKLEPQLDGLSSYHVRTAALHVFDCAVDEQSSWQRQSTVSLFLDVLAQLDRNLKEKSMPHFFFPSVNLFADVTPQTLSRWRARVHRLVENRAELLRVLRRRTEDHRMITSAND